MDKANAESGRPGCHIGRIAKEQIWGRHQDQEFSPKQRLLWRRIDINMRELLICYESVFLGNGLVPAESVVEEDWNSYSADEWVFEATPFEDYGGWEKYMSFDYRSCICIGWACGSRWTLWLGCRYSCRCGIWKVIVLASIFGLGKTFIIN